MEPTAKRSHILYPFGQIQCKGRAKAKINLTKNPLKIRTAKIWNTLPEHVRFSQSLNIFKNGLEFLIWKINQ